MAVGTLLGIADELLALPLAEFTPRRDALAKEHKADKELSAAVKSLRKPSLAAWVVNLLVRREQAQVEQMLAVGVALREAQANLDGEELRALTRQRRQLTAAITSEARGLAAQLGVKITEAVAEQVEATLTAGLVDESAAAAIRSGLLVTALTATGVDAVDVASAVALPEALGFSATPVAEPKPDLHVVPDPDADDKAVAAAQADVDAAEARLAKAVEDQAAAAAEVTELEARSMQVQSEIDELKRRLARLDTQAEEIDDELSDAEDVRAEAEGVVRQATRDRDDVQKVLDKLRRR
jgi:valyl-tRNA synthetase